MADSNHLAQARALVDELLENARSGAIIPVRLPGQIEAIAEALARADDGQSASSAPADDPPDLADYKRDQAEFMSTAIHELRIPMTSIRGYADMMNTPSLGELNDMQRQFLATIRTNTRRMEGLMQDVSDISKIRGGTLKANVKMDMFKNIALHVEKAMQPVAEELQRGFVVDVPQGMPILNTDGELLAKALSKIVENGLRYSEDGAQVTLTAEADGSNLRVIVQDTGIGMTEDTLAHLGELYYRADDDRVRNHKGSGLGLPIAFGIISLLDGTVQVDSTPEQGSTFYVTLAGMT